MGCVETQITSSDGVRLSDQHSFTRLLIRRFGVRIPGGPPRKPQVEGLPAVVTVPLEIARPVCVSSRTRPRCGSGAGLVCRNDRTARSSRRECAPQPEGGGAIEFR
jgi:hypothetical protein